MISPLDTHIEKAVLIVDDDDMVSDYLKDEFELEDWRVIRATNGNEALGLLANQEFDLIVSDMRMPGMDGMTLLSELKKTNQKDTPFVLISGFVDSADFAGHREKPHAFFSKPLDFDKLLEFISRI